MLLRCIWDSGIKNVASGIQDDDFIKPGREKNKMKNTELTKIREEKKLTKSALAALLGITPMLLGRYEKGTCAIPDSVAEKLKEVESQISEIRKESEDLSREIEKKDDQIRTIQTEADDLRKKSEEDQKTIEDLQKQRDEAQTEAQSFTRSIFGFYRKK